MLNHNEQLKLLQFVSFKRYVYAYSNSNYIRESYRNIVVRLLLEKPTSIVSFSVDTCSLSYQSRLLPRLTHPPINKKAKALGKSSMLETNRCKFPLHLAALWYTESFSRDAPKPPRSGGCLISMILLIEVFQNTSELRHRTK